MLRRALRARGSVRGLRHAAVQRANAGSADHLLLRRRGEVLPRSLIASQVWDMNFDGDSNVVEVAIRRLRSKLDEPFPTKLLHTVRGMGYVLELDRGNDTDA